jgi:hypothetical protein
MCEAMSLNLLPEAQKELHIDSFPIFIFPNYHCTYPPPYALPLQPSR